MTFGPHFYGMEMKNLEKNLLNNKGLELGMNSPPLKGSLIDTCSGMRDSLWQ
jgi:hypothetical protein